jgi:hypothetical protein
MKIRDLLFENIDIERVKKWAEHSCIIELEYANGDHDFVGIKRLADKLRVVNNKVTIYSPNPVEIFALIFQARPPINGDQWEEGDLHEYLSVDIEHFVLDDWKLIPKPAIAIEFKDDGCVRSFKGINEALPDLDVIHFGVNMQRLKPDVGMLNLLKSKSLRHIVTLGRHSDEFVNVVGIINKHLKSKDIADCMDELIEAGLKDWAKM